LNYRPSRSIAFAAVNSKNARDSSNAHETVDKVADASRQAADSLENKGEQLKNSEQKLIEECRTYMHEKPITTLTIVVSAGFMLSRLTSN
jgi:ElaB/YqjD/DUF883 family membrane-anchored ribosome-binding protein